MTPKLTKYIPHAPEPKQGAFLWLTCLDAFYGGAAGGGKSDALLMSALQHVDIPGYNAILFRNTYANLSKPEGLMDRANDWLMNTDAHWQGDEKRWRFPSGATLSFGYLDGPRDHFNHQGPAYQFVGIDEIVQVRENQARYMFSRARKKTPDSYIKDVKKLSKIKYTEKQLAEFYIAYKNLPIRFRGASNPPAAEQIARGKWVKSRYVDPDTREKDAIYIPAKLDDNPHLDKEDYIKSLNQLDPITRSQLLDGDWNIKAKGKMFQREWFKIVDAAPIEVEDTARFWDRASTEKVKEGHDPDWTSGSKLSMTNDGIIYIENVHRFRKSSRMNEQLIRQTSDMDGRNVQIYIEQEPGSSGKDVIDHYQRKVLSGFATKGISSSGTKSERAMPLASAAEAGNVYLVKGAWNKDFLDEFETFPYGEHDDQVDSTAGAYNQLTGKPIPRIREL